MTTRTQHNPIRYVVKIFSRDVGIMKITSVASLGFSVWCATIFTLNFFNIFRNPKMNSSIPSNSTFPSGMFISPYSSFCQFISSFFPSFFQRFGLFDNRFLFSVLGYLRSNFTPNRGLISMFQRAKVKFTFVCWFTISFKYNTAFNTLWEKWHTLNQNPVFHWLNITKTSETQGIGCNVYKMHCSII